MSRISKEGFKRIAEQAVGVLYDSFPVPLSTRRVAEQIVRDDEFTLKVLEFLEGSGVVTRMKEGKTGPLEKTVLWKISKGAREKMEKSFG
ncbi:hypothetical protein HZC09_04285 [Candidatus Micrarchaeota archaeon]|nr:hypothetical protein [Candidatus Micrarchaeota archaeon]